MKKLLLTTALVALSAPAYADSVVFKPYVGFDLQRSVYSYNDNYDIGGGLALDGETVLEDALNGFNIHIGNRFHENFGLEFGYFRTKEESKNIAAGTIVGPGTVAGADFETDVKVSGFTLDALGYVPLGNFDLIGTGGISWSKAELGVAAAGAASDVDESEIGFRAGFGAQYNFTDNVNARALIRYQSADFEDVVEHAVTGSLGLNYSF